MEPLRIQSTSGIHLPMQSKYPCPPLRHMEPLQIHSASGIHLPMQSEYPYHPLKHMDPLHNSVCLLQRFLDFTYLCKVNILIIQLRYSVCLRRGLGLPFAGKSLVINALHQKIFQFLFQEMKT